jgi:hypothetical protein
MRITSLTARCSHDASPAYLGATVASDRFIGSVVNLFPPAVHARAFGYSFSVLPDPSGIREFPYGTRRILHVYPEV